MDELFIHLKGKDCTWQNLASFQWRSTLGGWLRRVAWNKFREVLPKLIENEGHNISIDNDDPEKPKLQIPDGDEDSYELRLRRVMFMEAIRKLEGDLKFVVMKQVEGYKSKEIAVMLQERWKKHGIQKYNNDHELVVPDAGYVNVHLQRAKEILRKIMSN